MDTTDFIKTLGLSIDQVSQLTGVRKSTLRYWEKEYTEFLNPRRTVTNRRMYDMGDVEKVEVLRHLIEDEKYKSIGVKMKLGLVQ
jgi:DNA-binding transcriptional MerR regulator